MASELDLTVYIENRLAAVEIFSNTQSSRNVEMDRALKTASKNQLGNIGRPDHIATVEDFVLVMEDKSDRLKLVMRDGGGISQTVDATVILPVNDSGEPDFEYMENFTRNKFAQTLRTILKRWYDVA